LLRTTTLPVTEIALRIGCANQQHFSTLFRRATGTTPTALPRRALKHFPSTAALRKAQD